MNARTPTAAAAARPFAPAARADATAGRPGAPVRERLRTVALALFTREGYDAVSVQRLREAAGVSNGSFFHAFAGKDELAADLLVDCVERWQHSLLEALDARPGARAGVEGMLTAHLRWLDRHRDRARFMLDDARAAWFAQAAPELAARNAGFGAALDAWRAPRVARGELHDMPAEVFVALLVGPANLLCRAWVGGGAPPAASPSRHAGALVAAACRALVPAPTTATRRRSAGDTGRRQRTSAGPSAGRTRGAR